MSSEQLSNLPDLAAMIVLITILFVLQRRQPRVAIGTWLIAMVLTVMTEICWDFSKLFPLQHISVHVFTLNVELLAGLAFLLYKKGGQRPSRVRIRTIAWSLVPLAMLETLYGCDGRRASLYAAIAALGAVVGGGVAIHYRKSWPLAVVQISAWSVVGWLGYHGDHRGAAYTLIGFVYALASWNSYRELRTGSLGRVAIVSGLAIWSVSSFAHSWVIAHPFYRELAEQVFSLQRYFVTIGMLIVLLEDEIRENERLAQQDQLTGIANRRLLENRLAACIEQGHAGVVLIDLDDFKSVNDSLGHLAGDELLRETARRLLCLGGPGDTLARVGGDEFILLSRSPSSALTARVTDAFAEPFALDGQLVFLTASVGDAVYPEDAAGLTGPHSVSRLIQVADRRMYALKHALHPQPKRRTRFQTVAEPASATLVSQ